MRKLFKVFGWIMGGVFLLLSIYIGIAIYMISIGTIEFEPMKFEMLTWKNSEPEMSWESTRLKMADDLIENHLKVGLTKTEVIQLIGEPDETNYFNNYDMVYYLGRERNIVGIDSEWLVIKLKEDKVELFSLVND